MSEHPNSRVFANSNKGMSPQGPLAGIFRRKPKPTLDRLEDVLRLLEADAPLLIPQGLTPPPAVAKAVSVFESATDAARLAVDRLHKAEEDLLRASALDVRSAADAMKAKRKAPEVTAPAARQELERAELGIAGAEVLLIESHAALVEAVRVGWAELRRSLVEQAQAATAAARRQVEAAGQAIEDRRALLSAVLTLDRQVTTRFPEVRDEVQDETRCGLPVFSVAVAPYLHKSADTLTKVGSTHVLAAVETIREYLDAETPFLTEWSPPGDPERETLMQTPLPVDAGWVRRYVSTETGNNCPDCGLHIFGEVRLDPETLQPIHEGCQGPTRRGFVGGPGVLVVNR